MAKTQSHRPGGAGLCLLPSRPMSDLPVVSLPARASEEGTPVSVRIRERLLAARQRFHANDNIAGFIEPGELELLLDEVEAKMQGVLDSLVIDTAGDHNTQNTARRVAKMYSTRCSRAATWRRRRSPSSRTSSGSMS